MHISSTVEHALNHNIVHGRDIAHKVICEQTYLFKNCFFFLRKIWLKKIVKNIENSMIQTDIVAKIIERQNFSFALQNV